MGPEIAGPEIAGGRSQLPEPIRTSDPGSFAARTLAVRVPGILDDTVARNRFPAAVTARLQGLRDELTSGRLRGLQERAPDRAAWDEAAGPFVGRSWLALPWYFAEAYFYRRLLEATGYFQPGPTCGLDPFLPAKLEEERPDQAPRLVARVWGQGPGLGALLHASLWGNRVDLSCPTAKGLAGREVDEGDNLLVDDSEAALQHLAARRGEVVLLADNAGTELCLDLALAAGLLRDGAKDGPGAGRTVALLLKDHPFFVSDATPVDVERTLLALTASGHGPAVALADELGQARRAGRLELFTHPFMTSSRHFAELPGDLRARLARADLVIAKGDANYRRLCREARWPPTTPFAEATLGFPAPLLALRTLKAELCVGLPPGLAERLTATDPGWQVDGRRGVIQARGLASLLSSSP